MVLVVFVVFEAALRDEQIFSLAKLVQSSKLFHQLFALVRLQLLCYLLPSDDSTEEFLNELLQIFLGFEVPIENVHLQLLQNFIILTIAIDQVV